MGAARRRGEEQRGTDAWWLLGEEKNGESAFAHPPERRESMACRCMAPQG